jgi:hypothetical protein
MDSDRTQRQPWSHRFSEEFGASHYFKAYRGLIPLRFRDCATNEILSLEKVSTTNNVPDMMTKSVFGLYGIGWAWS